MNFSRDSQLFSHQIGHVAERNVRAQRRLDRQRLQRDDVVTHFFDAPDEHVEHLLISVQLADFAPLMSVVAARRTSPGVSPAARRPRA